mmetsp:Transcript_29025/g.72700  ORF Transcript_29025/g.72700 Transcript_29025/m.72700 type:complete len:277 (-) Transcript_29025:371-1201(-)
MSWQTATRMSASWLAPRWSMSTRASTRSPSWLSSREPRHRPRRMSSAPWPAGCRILPRSWSPTSAVAAPASRGLTRSATGGCPWRAAAPRSLPAIPPPARSPLYPPGKKQSSCRAHPGRCLLTAHPLSGECSRRLPTSARPRRASTLSRHLAWKLAEPWPPRLHWRPTCRSTAHSQLRQPGRQRRLTSTTNSTAAAHRLLARKRPNMIAASPSLSPPRRLTLPSLARLRRWPSLPSTSLGMLLPRSTTCLHTQHMQQTPTSARHAVHPGARRPTRH